jgi:hypothetical protein
MSGSELTRHEMTRTRVPSSTTCDFSQPCGRAPGAPILVWPPGDYGPGHFVPRERPAFETCWSEGSLAPTSIVMAHSTRAVWFDGWLGRDR